MRKWVVVACVAVLLFGSVISFFFLLTETSENASARISHNLNRKITPKIAVQPLNIELFFDDLNISQYPSEDIRVMVVTGDIIPARSVNFKAHGYDNYSWTVEKTADFLKQGDLTYINLETPLLEKCPLTNEGMIFCGDARHIQGLLDAGVDVANLANNHLGNQGKDGVDETARHLQAQRILPVGILNNPQYADFRGLKVAFLGYDDIEIQPGVSRADPDTIAREILEARKNADLVIIQFHWGVEYVSQPSPRQRELGRLAIDSGADLVIGNHPHWIQPVEIYKNKLITYAHGNFIFDQMWSEKTKEGVVGKYYFYKNQLIDVQYFPIYIKDYGQPQFIQDPAYRHKILNDMLMQSFLLRDKNIEK